MTSWRRLTLALLASTALCADAMAQDPSGSVVGTNPTVDARGPGGERILEIEGFVYQGDELTARPNGLAQIRFVDDTRLVVGPNSRLVIDEFVYNPNQTAQQVTIRLAKGAFRFISGTSPSDAYSIKTPTMTIGVRGTVVDVYAGVNGDESGAVFHDGSGDVCDAGGGSCVLATADCALWVVPQGGGVAEATGVDRQLRMQVRFPFLGNAGLDTAFHANTTACSDGGGVLFGTPPDNSNDFRPDRDPINETEGKDDDNSEGEYYDGTGGGGQDAFLPTISPPWAFG